MLKEKVMELWRTCFQDTDEFIRFYFDRKYQEQNTLVSYQGDRVISALQMLPYPMTWHGKEVNTSYISGACTLPEARNQGTMQKLLAEAFRTMKKRKIAFSVLLPQEPWLYNFYKKVGYAPVFAYTPENYYLPVRYHNPAVSLFTLENCWKEKKKLYRYFDLAMRKRPNCIQHTSEDWDAVIEELYMSQGELLVSHKPTGSITGMAFALPFPDKVRMNELLYDSEEEKSGLLHTAACHWGKSEIECKIPPVPPKTVKRGMARIIDAYQVLHLYAITHPRKSFLLNLNDPVLPFNNGYYRIRNGKCFRTGSGINKPDFQMDTCKLTEMLFDNPAFMSLMMD